MLKVDDAINDYLEKLWRFDEVSCKTQPLTEEQLACEKFYNENVCQTPTGRVIVRLPFKEDPHCLGDSQATALRRFVALER